MFREILRGDLPSGLSNVLLLKLWGSHAKKCSCCERRSARNCKCLKIRNDARNIGCLFVLLWYCISLSLVWCYHWKNSNDPCLLLTWQWLRMLCWQLTPGFLRDQLHRNLFRSPWMIWIPQFRSGWSKCTISLIILSTILARLAPLVVAIGLVATGVGSLLLGMKDSFLTINSTEWLQKSTMIASFMFVGPPRKRGEESKVIGSAFCRQSIPRARVSS